MRSADVDAVRIFLGRVALRLWWMSAAEGAALGLLLATGFHLLGLPTRASGVTPLVFGLVIALVAAVARAMVGATRTAGGRTPAARVEQVAPECRNLLLTAWELAADVGAPTRHAPTFRAATPVRAYVADTVLRDAAGLVGRLDPSRLFPLRRAAAIVGTVFVVWGLALAFATEGSITGRIATTVPTLDVVQVTVIPPDYVGGEQRTLRNPDRVEALEGSVLRLRAETNASAVAIATLDLEREYAVNADGSVAVDLAAGRDGFIAVEPRSPEGGAGERRLIGLTVLRDAAPRPRITVPGRDLLVPDGNRTVRIELDATDDVGLASLTLRYTRVSGSGERFTFTEGEVPLTLARRNPRAWSARVDWSIAPLKLEPGDMVVYRAVAADARPGAVPVESDAFIVEVTTPGGVAAAGFSVDPDDERYALSQQMIVLKTERLIARRPAPQGDSLAQLAAEIAAEQRRVRAEFVFMMGGEMSDAGANDTSMTEINEEEEAAAEADLGAGRQLNAGRAALQRAIRAMSLAARELDDANPAEALKHERSAVKHLEDAFSRNRILLRALAEREALDPTRRLSGDLTGVARVPRARLEIEADSGARAYAALLPVLRRLSEQAAGQGAESAAGQERESAAASAVRAAEAVLRVDPGSRAMQAAAGALRDAANAWRAGRVGEARGAIDRAARTLGTTLGSALPRLEPGAASVPRREAAGALADRLRRSRP